jgi:hypothetical protein
MGHSGKILSQFHRADKKDLTTKVTKITKKKKIKGRKDSEKPKSN